MALTEFEMWREVYRQVAELRNSQERDLAKLKSEFLLFRQESRHYRAGIIDRLTKLEQKAGQPMIDWNGLWQKLWVQLIILAAFATGNKQLVDLVKAAFGG